jgi:dipeptidyl aminopeptidase/acylaminoacyl peptidase
MKKKGIQYHDGPKFQCAFKNEEMINQSAIEVENIKAPILFISGKEDKVWPSFMMSEMMMKRLEQKQFQYDYAHYSYENAGHNFAGGGQGCGISNLVCTCKVNR